MAVESEHVELLRGWLADGSTTRSTHVAAEALVQKLAVVLFQGDSQWPDHADRVDDYRDRLRERFAHDSVGESQFVALTAPDADPGVFVDWFLRVVTEWEQTGPEEADEEEAGGAGGGLRNPHADGTPGTEYYRLDPVTGEYLYAASAGSQDWASYDQRRYTEPTHRHDYGLDCRYDRLDAVYQWYDETTTTWQDQAWADENAARADLEPAWDGERRVFYRLDRDGSYRYADARTPGKESSGCGEVWLTEEQAQARVIPVHLIPGWQALEGEPWAEDWYALLDGVGGYRYLHSPDLVPEAGAPGWSPVPPAPPVDLTPEEEEEIAALGFTLDDAADAIESLTRVLSAWDSPQE
ncbi:hypothetical protein ACIRQQ_15845 [Streptomyces fuscichromogenes]|uniref:hypothetical protein n=1 Tax=Streptomyces fuscichromogenes TaxID=1324013 RepID=UPI0037F1276C